MNQNPEQLGTSEQAETAEAAPEYPQLADATTIENADNAARTAGNRLTEEANKRLLS